MDLQRDATHAHLLHESMCLSPAVPVIIHHVCHLSVYLNPFQPPSALTTPHPHSLARTHLWHQIHRGRDGRRGYISCHIRFEVTSASTCKSLAMVTEARHPDTVTAFQVTRAAPAQKVILAGESQEAVDQNVQGALRLCLCRYTGYLCIRRLRTREYVLWIFIVHLQDRGRQKYSLPPFPVALSPLVFL